MGKEYAMYSKEFEDWWSEANSGGGNPDIIEAAKRMAWVAWQAAQPNWRPLTSEQVGHRLLVKAKDGKVFVGNLWQQLTIYIALDYETRRWVTVTHYSSQLENLWQE